MIYKQRSNGEKSSTVTMKDVGKLAGVSATTVSHVINQSRFVSEEVKTRVRRAMEELNYHPNDIARSLRQRTTNTIGLIISDILNPFFTSLVKGVEDVATKEGYNLILCNTDEKPDKQQKYLHVLRQKQVDGIIIAPTEGSNPYLAELARNNFPLVFIDRYIREIKAPAVVVNNEAGSYRAVEHLIKLGHKQIGVVTGLLHISTTVERLRGYEKAFHDYHLDLNPEYIKHGNSRAEGGYQAAAELLELSPRPTAIFATNNLMTIGVMKAIKEKGLTCPEDLAIVGFDDFEWASAFRPGLTVVAQPVYELGLRAAETLIKQIKNKQRIPRKIVLESALVIRESCGDKLKDGVVGG